MESRPLCSKLKQFSIESKTLKMSSLSVRSSSKSCQACPCYVDCDRFCHCGKRCKIVTSMTLKNLLRRFARCKKDRGGKGCEFFEWVDDPLCDKTRSMVVGLMIKNSQLALEIQKLGNVNGDEGEQREKLLKDVLRYKQEPMKLSEFSFISLNELIKFTSFTSR